MLRSTKHHVRTAAPAQYLDMKIGKVYSVEFKLQCQCRHRFVLQGPAAAHA